MKDTIIPHRILQRLSTHLRNEIAALTIEYKVNEARIIVRETVGNQCSKALHEEHRYFKKNIAKLAKAQGCVKRMVSSSGSLRFTHADLQRIEKIVTELIELKGMPEVQWWIRKQKAIEGRWEPLAKHLGLKVDF